MQALAARAREHVHTLCVGRTHGIHAEPTTFGIKLAGFAFEADRNARRLERAFEQVAVGRDLGRGRHLLGDLAGLRGAGAARGWGCEREPVSTQVVARDRHAELLQAIALAGAGLERFATELRHLARTEVGEVREPFARGQKGSSSMPHKRNPIKSEQVAGLARVLRGNALGRARERRPVARARHLALVGRADHPARLDDACSTTCSGARSRSSKGWSSTPRGCARTSS